MLSPCFESIVMYRMCGVSNTQEESQDDSIDVSLECGKQHLRDLPTLDSRLEWART